MNLRAIGRDKSRMIYRATLCLLLLAASASVVSAQAVSVIETTLVKGRCKFLADDGEVGHYALKRCPGLAGSQVYTTAGVNDVALAFKWGKRKPVEVFSNGGLGVKLEWRGTKSKNGFQPHAVIVERTFKRYVDDKPDKEEKHDIWAVIRMEKQNACLMAVVDAAANPDALTMARQFADAEAPSASCANLKPKVVGAETKWTKEAIGEDEPPK